MSDGIDADDFTLDTIDQTVREHPKGEPAHVAPKRSPQARKLEQELDRAVNLCNKSQRRLRGPLVEIVSCCGKLFVGLRHVERAHG